MNVDKPILSEEYETQFYEFTPSDLMEGIKSLIIDHFEDVISSLHHNLKKLPTRALPESELNTGIARLRQISADHNNKTLAKLESHLLKITSIPSHVLLPEDECHSANHTKTEAENLEEELKQLNVLIKNEKYVEAVLKEELKEINQILQSQATLLETFNSTENSFLDERNEDLKFLTESMKKTLIPTKILLENVETNILNNLKEHNSLQ